MCTRRRVRGRMLVAAAAAFQIASLLDGPSHAQLASGAAAQALFDEGKALMKDGSLGAACPKFEESERLDPSSGTLINLALCYEKTGRTASAWSAYRDAAAMSAVSGNVQRERGARQRAASLAPRVCKLTIEVPPAARSAGLVVTRDGVEMGTALWGVPLPTDEGIHEVLVRAPGFEPWRERVSVDAGGKNVVIIVPRLAAVPLRAVAAEPGRATARPGSAPHGRAAAVDETPPVDGEGSPLGAQRISALALGGAGVLGVLVGGGFGVKAMVKKNQAERRCRGTECRSVAGVTAGNQAHAAGNVSTVAFITGLAAVAGGVGLWLTAPKAKRPTTEVGLTPRGIVLRKVF